MEIICLLLQLYLLVLLARIVLSWFPVADAGPVASIQRFLFTLTEPILGPLRSVLPPVRLGSVALDLSPLVVLLGINVLLAWIGCGR